MSIIIIIIIIIIITIIIVYYTYMYISLVRGQLEAPRKPRVEGGEALLVFLVCVKAEV